MLSRLMNRYVLAAVLTATLSRILSGAQTISVQSLALPRLSVFLADRQLGIAGAYQSGVDTVYFEARTPVGSKQMSVRLLDAAGRTIAISGHSMDDVWLAHGGFDAASASRSLELASALPNALSNSLDTRLFGAEIAALSKLARGSAQVIPGTAAIVIDAATADLPSVSAAVMDAATNSDSAAANQLIVAENTPENLRVTLNGVTIQTFVENFPDGENEENPQDVLGRTEVSAQILSPSGKSLIQQIGGDHIPDGWDSPTTGMFRSGDAVDPIQASMEAGKAIQAAALMARFPSVATAEKTAAIGNLAATLRDDSLFPNPDTNPDTSSSPACGNCYKSSVQVWNKPLVVVAQHSGTVVLHYSDNNPSRVPVLQIETIYCNHGTCPQHSPMTHPCTYNGPWMGYYRFAPHYQITAPPPSPPSGYHSCYKTAYHLSSSVGWPVIHGHNCNDDTWTQVRAVRGESYDLDPSDNPFVSGARCDWHYFTVGLPDPRSPGCSE
jgi:hypothetical protein